MRFFFPFRRKASPPPPTAEQFRELAELVIKLHEHQALLMHGQSKQDKSILHLAEAANPESRDSLKSLTAFNETFEDQCAALIRDMEQISESLREKFKITKQKKGHTQ